MTIIVSKHGSKAEIVKPTGFDEERSLQEYIQENPESIPIYELREDKKLLILKREFTNHSGSIDALAIDKDGEIYIIETKLYKNPDKRKVIAQVLDYGAALWAHKEEFSKFPEIVEEEIQNKFKLSFEEKAKEFFEIQDELIDGLKSSIQNNLKDGKLKFIILMDSIDDGLKNLIRYVNQNSKFDIYGVQFEFYKIDNYEIVVPRLFGTEVKKDLSIRPTKISWDENLFFKELAKRGEKESNTARAILDWYRSKEFNIKWGTGPTNGTFYPMLEIDGKQINLLGVFTDGHIEIVFRDYPLDRETKSQLIKDINRIVGKISIKEKSADTWGSVKLSDLTDKPILERFIRTLENYSLKFHTANLRQHE